MHLKDKVALVTGAARGLGRAFAIGLLEQGAKVAIADILEDAGKETARDLCDRYGNRAIFIKCDVTKEEDRQNIVSVTKEHFGSLDVLVNNAGIVSIRLEDFKKLMDINLTAVVRLTEQAMANMGRQNGGRGGIIVNIASIASFDVGPSSGFYNASKHAVAGFTRSMMANCRLHPEWGLSVYCLGPGWVKTDLSKNWYENLDQLKTTRPPLYKYIMDGGGFMEPETVADALMKLLQDEPRDEDFLFVAGYGNKYIHHSDLYSDLIPS